MRISDWSSDVCSSDLRFARRFEARGGYRSGGRKARPMNTLVVRPTRVRTAGVRQQILLTAQQRLMILMLLFMAAFLVVSVRLLYFALFDTSSGRSEEHTSALQSLMRISYADFCLKKKI